VTIRASVDDTVATRTRGRALVLFVVFSTVVLSGVSLSSITVVFPELRRAFPGTRPADLSWVASVFTIVSAATVLPAAALADRHGRRRTITVGLLLFAAGSVIAGAAPNPALIVAGRGVQALGSAACTPAAAALLMSVFPPSRLPLAMGLWSAGIGVSNSIGPPLAGVMIAAGGWRWVFLFSLPVAVVAVAAAIAANGKVVDRPTDPSASLPDPIGSLLVVSGVAPLVFALVRSSTWGWSDLRTLSLAAIGGAVLAMFVVRCGRSDNPLVDLNMFRLPMFGAGIAGGFVMTATWFCTYWGVVLYVTSEWGWSAIRAGLATSPVPLLAGVTGMSVNQIARRTGLRVMIFIGAGLLVLTSVVVWLSIGETPSTLAVVVSSTLMGIGSGCVLTPFSTAALLHVPPPRHATATGVSVMSVRLANTFGVAVAITFFARDGALASLHRCLVVTAFGAAVVAYFGSRIGARAGASK
jgi:EmrB/QacA subfamily drug resistance transporter